MLEVVLAMETKVVVSLSRNEVREAIESYLLTKLSLLRADGAMACTFVEVANLDVGADCCSFCNATFAPTKGRPDAEAYRRGEKSLNDLIRAGTVETPRDEEER